MPSRRVPLFILVASVAILGTAFAFQYWDGLAPCELCLYQRYPYDVAILLALLAFILPGGSLRRGLILLCGLAFLADAGIALFHVGVEQHWWEGLAACSAPENQAGAHTLDSLRAQLEATPVVRCDHIAWSLFGISMAGYNFVAALLLALFSFAAGGRRRLRSRL
jgi:disulfide bond formation protein DsbB